MGTASKAISMILRVGELICACVVCGIMGHYLSLQNDANASYNSRIVFAVAMASISIFFSLVLMPPLKYSFWAFPLDFAIFICWMVCFGLLENLTSNDGCNSYFMWHDWGYYWGGWWRTVPVVRVSPTIVTSTYCSNWRASLAFAFIGGIGWLASGCLGLYATVRDYHEAKEKRQTRAMEERGEPPGLTEPKTA